MTCTRLLFPLATPSYSSLHCDCTCKAWPFHAWCPDSFLVLGKGSQDWFLRSSLTSRADVLTKKMLSKILFTLFWTRISEPSMPYVWLCSLERREPTFQLTHFWSTITWMHCLLRVKFPKLIDTLWSAYHEVKMKVRAPIKLLRNLKAGGDQILA